GAIQAGVSQPPDSLTLEAKGFHVLYDLASQKLPSANTAVAVRRSYISQNKAVVQRYIDSIVQGIKKLKSDKAFGVSVLKKYFSSTDEASMSATYDFYALSVAPTQPFAKPEMYADGQAVLGANDAKVKAFDVTKMLDSTFVQSAVDRELTGIQKHFDGSYPILFNNVKGYPHVRAITNFFANMDVVDRLFGWADRTARTRELAHSLTHPIPNEEVSQSDAPVQQEVITDDLDVNKYIFPIRHTHLESEITIGSGHSVLVGDRFCGGSHIGYNRMNFRWGNIGTFQISPGSHMWQVMTKYYK